jgi:hypothetical protein
VRPVSHHPNRDDHPAEGRLGPALADMMADLRDSEPRMPDLLGPAMAEGTRIRRRRRTTMLVALAVAGVLVGGGAVTTVAYIGHDRQSAGPAHQPIRSDVPDGTVALADVLRPHLTKYQLVMSPDAVRAWNDAAGHHVLVTLRDQNGHAATLDLSTAAMGMPVTSPPNGTNCEAPYKFDITSPVALAARRQGWGRPPGTAAPPRSPGACPAADPPHHRPDAPARPGAVPLCLLSQG